MLLKLKITALVFLLTTGLLTCFAQMPQTYGNADNSYPWTIRQNLNDTSVRSKIVDLKIKKEEITRVDSKGNKAMSINRYNENGSISQYGLNSRVNKKYNYSYALKYNENGLASMDISNYKGELHRAKTYERDPSGNVLTYISKDNSKKAFIYKIENEITDGNLNSRSIYKNGKQDSKYQNWIYSYHENGSKALTKFFKKEKLKYTWNYDCKPEGIESKTQDTSTICSWNEEDANGNPIKWTKTTNEKGKVIKAKTVVNKGNNELLSYESWDIAGTPLLSNIRTADKWTYTRYNKGEVNFQSTSNIDPKSGRILSNVRTFKRHPKLNSTTDYVYDDNGLILKEISYRNGKLHDIISTKREYYK